MARLPRITVQGWTADGPAYTIHHQIAGWRNRRDRRAGTGGDEQVGDHDAIEDAGGPAAFMLFAKSETEVYAFKAGHVYQVTLELDGDPVDVLVDAREEDRLETYGAGINLVAQRALEGDELDAVLAEGPEQPEQVDETAATAAVLEAVLTPDTPEHDGVITSLTGAQTEEPAAGTPITEQDAANAATPRDPDAGNPEQIAPGLEISDEAVASLSAVVEAVAADVDEPSTGDLDYDGTVPEFVELVEAMDVAELEGFAATDSRKGVREAAQRELDTRAQQSSPEDHGMQLGDSDSASGDGE